jgi:hypothetical protein
MTCTHCGNYVAEGAPACPSCGTRVAGNVGQPQAWAQPSGPADDLMSPSTPSWSPSGQQPGAQGPSWSPSGQQPGPWGQAGGPGGPAPHSSGYHFDARRWTISDKVAGISTLVVLISLFLPWFTASLSSNNALGYAASSGSESGADAHGWLWLVFVISVAILAYLGLMAGGVALPFKLPLAHIQLLLVATGVNLVLVFVGFIAVPSNDGIAGLSVGWSFGAILALLAALVAVGSLTPIGRQKLSSGASLSVSRWRSTFFTKHIRLVSHARDGKYESVASVLYTALKKKRSGTSGEIRPGSARFYRYPCRRIGRSRAGGRLRRLIEFIRSRRHQDRGATTDHTDRLGILGRPRPAGVEHGAVDRDLSTRTCVYRGQRHARGLVHVQPHLRLRRAPRFYRTDAGPDSTGRERVLRHFLRGLSLLV